MKLFNKINLFFATLNYSYALRLVLGIAITWGLAFRLNTDKPYWAIMTVIIVTLPTQNELLRKFIARLTGTIIGAICVNIIAGIALDDLWLFTIYMAIWLSICSYLASVESAMVTYCFALCGYTSAILGFSLSVSPSDYVVFQISQARILEIIIGLVTAFFVSMLWPSYLEHRDIRMAARSKKSKVRSLYLSLLTPDFSQQSFLRQYQQTLHFRHTVFQSFISVSAEKRRVLSIYQYGYELILTISEVLLLASMKNELLQTHKEAIEQYLSEQKAWFLKVQLREQKIAQKPKAPKALLKSPKGRHFVQKMDDKLIQFLSLWFNPQPKENLYIPNIRIDYRDHKEGMVNAARTFVSIMVGMVFWMETQWESGYILLVLLGMMCTLGATYPGITRYVTINLILMIFLIVPIAYVLKYGLLIQVNGLLPAMMIILPLYFVAALFKMRSRMGFIVGNGFLMCSVFIIGFTNPMEYNFAHFANNTFSTIIAVLIVLIAFYVIPPSSNEQKILRIKKNVQKRFIDVEKSLSVKTMRDYETYLYSALNKAKIIPETPKKVECLIYVFLTLVILRRQLQSIEAGKVLTLPVDLKYAFENEHYEEALTFIESLQVNEEDEQYIAYWELASAIHALHFLRTSVAFTPPKPKPLQSA